uniref:Uncharacterized protein n=1 Tax=Anguilla anguilla TaxID=7936 RepID=A0A0E9W0T2_ANGAN
MHLQCTVIVQPASLFEVTALNMHGVFM